MSKSPEFLQKLYEETAQDFAKRVRERLGSSIHSIVLYGSVARKTAGQESDIDVLILTDEGPGMLRRLIDIGDEVDYDQKYTTCTNPLPVTAEHLDRLWHGGYPVAEDIMNEGRVLYDDGTFERVRKNAAAVS